MRWPLFFANGRIDQFNPMCPEAGDRTGFIGLHQAAIASHIGCQHCS